MSTDDIDDYAALLRGRAIDLPSRRVLLSVIAGSDQEPDLTEPTVIDGLGRIRVFRRETSPGWPQNTLPIAPATRALGVAGVPASMPALVFQNAVCNWRCWYCFVPFNMLAAHPARSRWTTCDELVGGYLQLSDADRPNIIDLSGGQPDLIPEWTIWMLDALEGSSISNQVYLWSDDNLSNDYLFRFLTDGEIARLAGSSNYGRVGCLKGYDADSFAFNTAAPPSHYERQFEMLRRIWTTGIDLYLYATFTTPVLPDDPIGVMHAFVDRLQEIDEHLPRRLVPLEIRPYSPVRPRIRGEHRDAMGHQQRMVEAWLQIISERLPTTRDPVETGTT